MDLFFPESIYRQRFRPERPLERETAECFLPYTGLLEFFAYPSGSEQNIGYNVDLNPAHIATGKVVLIEPSRPTIMKDGVNAVSEVHQHRKPDGPLSKPNNGGYSLRESLNWDYAFYKSVQKGMQLLCKKHFNLELRYIDQKPEERARFLREACGRYPIFASYENEWPAQDFATMYLKNTSASRKTVEFSQPSISRRTGPSIE